MINQSGQFDDVENSGFDHVILTIGTTAVELKVGASRRDGRQELRVYNASNSTIYIGKATVTTSGSTQGEPLVKGQWISYNFGDDVGVYAIAGSAGNSVFVLEKG